MPAAVFCPRCDQKVRSPLHHCTPSRVAKMERIRKQFAAFKPK